MKKRILLPSLCVVFGLLLVACGTTEETVNRNAAPPAPTSASPASTPATVASSSGEIGVPACDDFIAAYDACVSSKVPEAVRAQYKTSIEQWRTSWRQLATNPNTRATLAQVCTQAAEQQRVAMKSYNCTF